MKSYTNKFTALLAIVFTVCCSPVFSQTGCTNPTAFNYNPFSITDDDTCEFEQSEGNPLSGTWGFNSPDMVSDSTQGLYIGFINFYDAYYVVFTPQGSELGSYQVNDTVVYINSDYDSTGDTISFSGHYGLNGSDPILWEPLLEWQCIDCDGLNLEDAISIEGQNTAINMPGICYDFTSNLTSFTSEEDCSSLWNEFVVDAYEITFDLDIMTLMNDKETLILTSVETVFGCLIDGNPQFNALANTNDSSCSEGCFDEAACNFGEEASCYYPEGYCDCEGELPNYSNVSFDVSMDGYEFLTDSLDVFIVASWLDAETSFQVDLNRNGNEWLYTGDLNGTPGSSFSYFVSVNGQLYGQCDGTPYATSFNTLIPDSSCWVNINTNFIAPFMCNVLEGCMDLNATNYNEMATQQQFDQYGNLTCIYSSCDDVPYSGCVYADGFGPFNSEFQAEACVSYGGNPCDVSVNGCTDATAQNFDMFANVDDGTCFYCQNPIYFNVQPDTSITDNVSGVLQNENDFMTYFGLGAIDLCFDSGCFSITMYTDFPGGFENTTLVVTDKNQDLIVQHIFGASNSETINFTIGQSECNLGCTSIFALNYNEDAEVNDGSCEFEGNCANSELLDCNGNCAPMIWYADGFCDNNEFEFGSNPIDFTCFDNDGGDCDTSSVVVVGCMDSAASNFMPEALEDDGSCEYLSTELIEAYQTIADLEAALQQAEFDNCTTTEVYIPLTLPQGWGMFGYSCMEPMNVVEAFSSVVNQLIIVKDNYGNPYLPEFNFDGLGDLHYSHGYQIKVTEEITDLSFCSIIVNSENSNGNEIFGCMDNTALNFDPLANLDNGLCQYVNSNSFNLPLDFEGEYYEFVDFDGTSTFVIQNPNPTDVNPSENVVRHIRHGGELWAGTYIVTNPINFSSSIFKMKIQAPAANIPVLMKLENANTGEFVELIVNTTLANQWEELTFDFGTPLQNNLYTQVVVIFNIGVVGDGSENSTYYFDDIINVN